MIERLQILTGRGLQIAAQGFLQVQVQTSGRSQVAELTGSLHSQENGLFLPGFDLEQLPAGCQR